MNILSRIFKKPPAITHTEVIGTPPTVFTPFSGNAYSNDIFRSAVDAIARNAAKLKACHVIKTTAGRTNGTNGTNGLDRLLQTRPNPYMSAYDMLYRMVTHYFLYNNAFAYLQKDIRGNLTGIYPIRAASVEFITDLTDTMFCRFLLHDGKQYTLPYVDVIHLRRHYNDNDMLGDPNTALLPALELAHAMSQGIIKGIQNGAHLRDILKMSLVMNEDTIQKARDRFVKDHLAIDNTGGVMALDQKWEYQPLDLKPYVIDEGQLSAAKRKIYDYLGVSE
jgi:HK97 family phage portal protein